MKVSYKNFEKLLSREKITAYRVVKDNHFSQSSLTQWKAGTYIPNLEKLYKLSRYFKVPLEYFIEEKDDKPKLKVDFKAKREAKGLSVKDICVLTNIKEKDYLNIERGVKEATSDEMELLKTILNF